MHNYFPCWTCMRNSNIRKIPYAEIRTTLGMLDACPVPGLSYHAWEKETGLKNLCFLSKSFCKTCLVLTAEWLLIIYIHCWPTCTKIGYVYTCVPCWLCGQYSHNFQVFLYYWMGGTDGDRYGKSSIYKVHLTPCAQTLWDWSEKF